MKSNGCCTVADWGTGAEAMTRRTCPWCGTQFTPRTSGGKPQRFCSPRCRREHEAGLQAWARDQEAAGRVTVADIQRARWPDA